MKRSLSLLLILSLLCALLAGCAGTACPPASGGGDQEPSPKGAPATARCRVVSVSENNVLLLADVDSERGDIYTLDAGELSLEHDQAELGELLDDGQLAVGALVEVAFGGDILESYPALFGGVERITVLPDEFDDRCALYLRVLNDLWGKDEGLNSSGVEYISVDLAATSLTPAERSAVAWTFAQSHSAEPAGTKLRAALRGGLHQRSGGREHLPRMGKRRSLHHHRDRRSGHIQSAQPLGGRGGAVDVAIQYQKYRQLRREQMAHSARRLRFFKVRRRAEQ